MVTIDYLVADWQAQGEPVNGITLKGPQARSIVWGSEDFAFLDHVVHTLGGSAHTHTNIRAQFHRAS